MTLTTDFGHRDWYVAAVKGVVLSRVPEAQIVDICHEVPPGDVATASFLLQAAAPNFPADTVHLAVVDPGVGTDRDILAVGAELPTEDVPRRQVFVAPDNGLLHPYLERGHVVTVDRADLFRDAPGHTFHGRDRFAPVAAALLQGESLERLGDPADNPVLFSSPHPERTQQCLRGTVRHVDHFGNLVTDLPAGWLESDAFEVAIAGHVVDLRVDTYRQIPTGRAAVLTGSLGTLELSLDGADLADAWGVEPGTAVTVQLGPGSTRKSRTGFSPADGEQHDPVGVPHRQHSE
ncbi:MAG: SAM-dependent chlorinase/fluorinase [Thermoanaerobaculia bacterium]|nr:SAM-dependent chlorinase/fluorinase [Thermoanaerobaculia bacterium]